MSQQAVKNFFDFVKKSEDIQHQFKNGVSYEGIVSIASGKGYEFNEQELQEHLKEDETLKVVNKEELSEQELEAVSGGGIIGAILVVIALLL